MSIEPMQVVRSHKSSMKAGILVGLLLLCGVVGYLYASTPTKPNVQTAGPRAIVEYVSHDRGLISLPQVEQEHFLKQWQNRISSDDKSRDELKECFKNLSDDDRKRFSMAMTKQFKRAFIDDAKRYATLDAKEKFNFLTDRITVYAGQAQVLKEVTKDSGFKKDLPGGPDEVQVWIMENTTAEERAIGEPYVDALKRIREQQRKQGATAKP